MVNEPLVFESLKFYCTSVRCGKDRGIYEPLITCFTNEPRHSLFHSLLVVLCYVCGRNKLNVWFKTLKTGMHFGNIKLKRSFSEFYRETDFYPREAYVRFELKASF